jgi:hypothetical protein
VAELHVIRLPRHILQSVDQGDVLPESIGAFDGDDGKGLIALIPLRSEVSTQHAASCVVGCGGHIDLNTLVPTVVRGLKKACYRIAACYRIDRVVNYYMRNSGRLVQLDLPPATARKRSQSYNCNRILKV